MTNMPRFRLVAGLQPVREAIRIHKGRLDRVIIELRRSPRLEAIERFARDQGVNAIERLPGVSLDRLSNGVEHQGVVCWAPPLQLVSLDDLLRGPSLLAIALDQIQDPQNFGAIIRSAVGIADAAVIWGEHASAPLSPATFRASAGAIEQAKLCRVKSLRDALGRCASAGAIVIGLDAHATQPLHELSFAEPTILVLGSEHRGLGRSIKSSCTGFAKLVSSGKLDSLNASVAAGIALHTVHVSRIFSKG